jgi:hypothetical protein
MHPIRPIIRLGFFSFMLLSSCATIVGDKNQLLPVSSTPDGALITIRDEKGAQVFKGTTPTNVTLQKSDGSYWGKKSYTIEISKKGYKTQSIPLTASANGWYIGGNLVFGGLIGWFVIDPLNGAMYKLSPKQVDVHLGDPVACQEGKGLPIVLLEDVAAEDRQHLVRLDEA